MANVQQSRAMKRFRMLASMSLCAALAYAFTIKSLKLSRIVVFRALSFIPGSVEIPLNINNNLLDTIQYVELKNSNIDIGVTPFYWHIPKAGGTTVQDEYVECFSLVEASEIGGVDQGNSLELVEINGGNYHVNVDTSILPGILHAAELDLVPSQMAEIIFSPLLHESSTHLFSPNFKGQMFAMFRHPVDRVISLFYYLRSATWEPTYNSALQNQTLLEYAESELAENNFMVRSLVDKMEGELSMSDLRLAKEILKQKCLVGLLDRWEASINRFDSFFGFQPHGDRHEQALQCRETLRAKGGSNKHQHPIVNRTSAVYAILERENALDLILYEYVQELFQEQELFTKHLFVEDQLSYAR